MPTLPSSLALETIDDGSQIIASEHRNNYAGIQAGHNALLGILDDGVAGQFLKGVGTTVSFDYPHGHRYDHTEFTSSVACTATTEATANTIVTAGAVTFDGATPVVISFFSEVVAGSVALVIRFWLYDGVASIGSIGEIDLAGTTSASPAALFRRLTPSAAAHTYSVRASVNTGTGTVFAGAGGNGLRAPGFIRIHKD